MIHIDKTKATRPSQLDSSTTAKRREECIKAKKYLKGKKYNARYKTKDVKKALADLYHNKCAFCETNVERWDVEHFRPKSLYPWLAFSWDNLLLACPTCNGNKSNHFETMKKRAKFEPKDLKNIHNLSKKYDTIENNKFIHPELETDIEKKIKFDKDGMIFTKDERLQYTIDTCKLDREKLNIERKKQVLDTYEKTVMSLYLVFKDDDTNFKKAIDAVNTTFKEQAETLTNNFIAFRRFAVKNFIIN